MSDDPTAAALRASILEEFSFLGQHGRVELHPAESVLMREGEPGEHMFIIKHGMVEVTREGQLLALLEDGAIVGEMLLINDGPRSATAICADDCELIKIERKQFMELARTNMEFFLYIMRIQSERLSKTSEAHALHRKPQPATVPPADPLPADSLSADPSLAAVASGEPASGTADAPPMPGKTSAL